MEVVLDAFEFCVSVTWTLQDWVWDAQLCLERDMIVHYHQGGGGGMEFGVFLSIFVEIPLNFVRCVTGIFLMMIGRHFGVELVWSLILLWRCICCTWKQIVYTFILWILGMNADVPIQLISPDVHATNVINLTWKIS